MVYVSLDGEAGLVAVGLAELVRPCLVAPWRQSAPGRTAEEVLAVADEYRRHLWWTLFLAGGLFARLAAYKYKHATTLTEARSGVTQDMVSDVLHLGAAAAAVYFAYQLTVMQQVKATAGPFGPAAVQGRVAEGTL
ncbi:hypothetical protein [Streptomyces sp. NPDC005301]|uniref:hypothetical protein n=1 Tax=Streptomyces sp. NPDC005301 TaxID=3156874 RepID=UPI0033AD85B7